MQITHHRAFQVSNFDWYITHAESDSRLCLNVCETCLRWDERLNVFLSLDCSRACAPKLTTISYHFNVIMTRCVTDPRVVGSSYRRRACVRRLMCNSSRSFSSKRAAPTTDEISRRSIYARVVRGTKPCHQRSLAVRCSARGRVDAVSILLRFRRWVCAARWLSN